jgi:transketolase
MVTPKAMAHAIRFLAIDAVEAAQSGHPGMPMGMADAASILFTQVLKYDPSDPHWPDRDRFVLSAGHGSMLLYALLHLTGYAQPTLDQLKAFRQWDSPCAGHPEYGALPGIETTTGPLGQGLATAVGMALAERHLNAHYGDDLVDHYTYVIAGDGCLMEGVSQEALGLAGHLKLGRLIVLWDDNKISIDGPTSLTTSEDQAQRFAAAGWHVVEAVDGHDSEQVLAALLLAKADPCPSLLCVRTTIGYGAPTKAGSKDSHGSPLGTKEAAATREALGWQAAPFTIPEEISHAWRAAGQRHQATRKAWEARLAAAPKREAFLAQQATDLGLLKPALEAHIAKLLDQPQKIATRKASELVLEAVNAALPYTLGGSADLTGSNNTKTKGLEVLNHEHYAGRYLHYGVREFGMAAAMNGLALHGGIIPYGGTFLVFADYCRPAIRLSALQHQRVIYVMTHDSIGLGEDGPTHQPIEHLASLRAIPNLMVLRPCDSVETAECWQLALENTRGPSLLALTRQNLAQLRLTPASENLSARGGYIISDCATAPQVVLMATGSEVEIAVATQKLLLASAVAARVISMPCLSLFDAQPLAYRQALVPDNALKVAIEAGASQGWHKYVGAHGLLATLDHFGASAPYQELYKHYGLTADALAKRILAAVLPSTSVLNEGV